MGFSGSRRPARASLIADRQRFDGIVLTEDHPLERGFEIFQNLGIVLGDVLGRDARDLGDNGLDLFRADGFAALGFGHQMLGRARLVDHVNRLVGQLCGR